jgi:hypothetical protein
MTPIYSVTVVNLDATAQSAVEGGGPLELGQLTAAEVTALLDTFAELDAVQNQKADPEIRIQTRRDRFFVRTGQKKLFLYDARRPSEPAYVLSTAEVIAELDGSAAAKRTAPPIAYSPNSGTAFATDGSTRDSDLPPPPPPRPPAPPPYALMAVVALLAGYIGYAEFTAPRREAGPALAPIAATERLTEDTNITGVFMTGSEPGHHGIIILGGGKLKLFRVNAQSAPSILEGTYTLGRLGSKLAIATNQPGGVISVAERHTLEYCGMKFQRIQ